MDQYMDIGELSAYLHIKRSTLYAWVGEDRIPHVKLGRLIRFRRDEIDQWIESHRPAPREPRALRQPNRHARSIDAIIARAKREVYTPRRGKPDQDRAGKEGSHGSV